MMYSKVEKKFNEELMVSLEMESWEGEMYWMVSWIGSGKWFEVDVEKGEVYDEGEVVGWLVDVLEVGKWKKFVEEMIDEMKVKYGM